MYLWLRQIVGDNNPSLSTDAPVNLLVLLSALALLRSMESASRDTSWLLLCSLTAATAASIKLTGYPWLAASTLLILFLLAFQRSEIGNSSRQGRPDPPPVARPSCGISHLRSSISAAQRQISAFQLFSISAFFLSLDLIRGILISGYPLFPSSFAGLHALPWAVVPQFLGGATDGIRSWPTRDTVGSGFFEFLRIWIENQFGFANITFATIMLIGLFGAALLVLIVNGPDRCWKILRPRLLLWTVLLVSLLVCFSYAPALRFVSGYFFALAGLTLGLLICMLPGNWSQHIGKPLTLIMILAAFAANIPGMISRPIALVGIPELPIPQLEIRSTMQGEELLIAIDSFPWAAPLPVSSHFDPHIQIQRSATGKIQMIHMPQKN